MTLFNLSRGDEKRSLPLTWWNLFAAPTETTAGVSVNEDTMQTISAVFRAINLIASVSASLNLYTYKKGSKDKQLSRLLDKPHPWLTPYQVWRLSYIHRLMWGNSYTIKHYDLSNRVTWLEPIYPTRVEVFVEKATGQKIFIVDSNNKNPLTTHEMMHIPVFSLDGITGRSVVTTARESFGISRAADLTAARQFGSGNLLSGILSTDDELSDPEIAAAKARWKATFSGPHNAYDIAVMHRGVKFQSLNMSSADAQFLESRAFQVAEVARWFGVPLFLMMETQRVTSWGTGLEQQALGWLQFDLGPTWLVPTQQQISMELLLDPNVEARYDVKALLRGDTAALMTFVKTAYMVSAMTPNEIRDTIDLPRSDKPGMDDFYQPINMAVTDDASAQDDATEPTQQPDADAPDDTEPVADDGNPA